MAKIGLNSFRYGIINPATNVYEGALTPGKAISCSVSITNNDAKLYADDVLQESDTSFAGGTVTMGIDRDDDTTMSNLLGHTITDGVMVRSANDIAPYVGLGRIIVKMVDGAYKYKVEFLNKVKFSEPSQDNTTKGENVEFSTYELEGIISALPNGTWSKSETFDTKAEALTYLEGLLGSGTSI